MRATRHGDGEPSRQRSVTTGVYRSFYAELMPQMYRKRKAKPHRRSISPQIHAWLVDNGPATQTEIAAALGVDRSTISIALRRGIDGIGVVGQRLPEKGVPVQTWGVIDA